MPLQFVHRRTIFQMMVYCRTAKEIRGSFIACQGTPASVVPQVPDPMTDLLNKIVVASLALFEVVEELV